MVFDIFYSSLCQTPQREIKAPIASMRAIIHTRVNYFPIDQALAPYFQLAGCWWVIGLVPRHSLYGAYIMRILSHTSQ